MIDWRRVPWSLWMFCGVIVLQTVRVEIAAPGPILVEGLSRR
jgi:hypothetical protein